MNRLELLNTLKNKEILISLSNEYAMIELTKDTLMVTYKEEIDYLDPIKLNLSNTALILNLLNSSKFQYFLSNTQFKEIDTDSTVQDKVILYAVNEYIGRLFKKLGSKTQMSIKEISDKIENFLNKIKYSEKFIILKERYDEADLITNSDLNILSEYTTLYFLDKLKKLEIENVDVLKGNYYESIIKNIKDRTYLNTFQYLKWNNPLQQILYLNTVLKYSDSDVTKPYYLTIENKNILKNLTIKKTITDCTSNYILEIGSKDFESKLVLEHYYNNDIDVLYMQSKQFKDSFDFLPEIYLKTRDSIYLEISSIYQQAVNWDSKECLNKEDTEITYDFSDIINIFKDIDKYGDFLAEVIYLKMQDNFKYRGANYYIIEKLNKNDMISEIKQILKESKVDKELLINDFNDNIGLLIKDTELSPIEKVTIHVYLINIMIQYGTNLDDIYKIEDLFKNKLQKIKCTLDREIKTLWD